MCCNKGASEILVRGTEPSMNIQIGPSTLFSEAGRQLAGYFTLNRRQSMAIRLICRQLNRVRRDEPGTPSNANMSVAKVVLDLQGTRTTNVKQRNGAQ